MVVYDSTQTPRVNITPEAIGSFSAATPETFAYFNQFVKGNSPGNQYTVTTEKQTLGNVGNGSLIAISNINGLVQTYKQEIIDGGSGPATDITIPSSISMTIVLYCNNIEAKRWTLSSSTKQQYGYFIFNNKLEFVTTQAGTYTANAIIDGGGGAGGTDKLIYGVAQFRYAFQTNTLTKVATDGLLVKTDADSQTYIGKDGFIVKQENYVKKIDKYGEWKGQQVGLWNDAGSQMSYELAWFPACNFRPITFSSDSIWKQTYIQPIGETKWAYEINPLTDIGDFVIMYAPLNTSTLRVLTRELWVLLPTYYTYKGTKLQVPAGYRIRIFNATFGSGFDGDNRCSVYVSCKENSNMSGIGNYPILDSNRNLNRYCELTGPQTSDEYIWNGTCWMTWRDTQ